MAYFPYTRFDFDSAVNYYSPLTFDYTDTEEVKVIISDVDGNSEKLTYGIDYTLESSRIKINSPDTLGTKYSMTVTKLFAIRMLGETATPEFNYGVYLDVKKVQSALESMALQIAELQMISGNTVRLSYEEWNNNYDNPIIIIPTATGRANKVFTFDSNGNVLMQSATDFIPGLNQIVAAVTESKNAAAQSAQAAQDAEDDVVLMKASIETSKTELEGEITTAYTEIESKKTEAITAVKSQETTSKAVLQSYETSCKAYADSAEASADRIDADEFYTKTEVDDKLANVETNLPLEMNSDGKLCYVIE